MDMNKREDLELNPEDLEELDEAEICETELDSDDESSEDFFSSETENEEEEENFKNAIRGKNASFEEPDFSDEDEQLENEEDVESGESTSLNKKKKSKKKLLLIIPALLIVSVIIIAVYVNNKLNRIQLPGEGLDYTLNTDESFIDDETIDFGEIDDVTGNSYKDILKNWALTTDAPKMYDKNVLNVLLIGSDASSKSKKRADVMENGNTDVMMIVSVNKKDRTIKLISIMRDSYLYLKGYDKFAKLNAACANGGPAYLVDVIEDSYKIKIDGYVMVDFDTFVQCIDILGGVTVDVPQSVGVKNDIPYGNGVTLNGEQALLFCRERYAYADADVSRTRNQRMVIYSLIEKYNEASLTKINNLIDTILANVHTSFRKKEIVNYMTKALTEGWANYTVSQRTMPTADARYGYLGSAWIWVIDYPLAAQKLQQELYGTTNIKLEENRETAITVMGGYVTEDKGD